MSDRQRSGEAQPPDSIAASIRLARFEAFTEALGIIKTCDGGTDALDGVARGIEELRSAAKPRREAWTCEHVPKCASIDGHRERERARREERNAETMEHLELRSLISQVFDGLVPWDGRIWRQRVGEILGRAQRDRDTWKAEAARHELKWRGYEREYILPAFAWADEVGFDLKAAVSKGGGNCVSLLVRHLVEKAQPKAAPSTASSCKPDLVGELIDHLIGEDAENACLVCGSHHDLNHVTYDADTSCVVSRLLVARRAAS